MRKDIGQSEKMSLIEVTTNTLIGWVVSCYTWMWFIAPMFGFDSQPMDVLAINAIFTVISVIRSYACRRLFNYIEKNRGNKR